MDRLCETTLLLEAMSLDDIYTKYYSDIDREVFDKIASADPTGKPDKKGKYTEWLLNLYKADNLKMEDLYKATDYLGMFHKFKNRIEQKDIRAYKSLPELYNVVKQYIDNPDQATSKSDERRKVKNDEAEKVYEDSEWLVIVPHTKRAAIEYGKGTQWCTAATGSYNYFDDYNNDGPLYININKRTGKKYQFHFESHQFMDENDNATKNKYIGLSDGLKDFYIKKYGKKALRLFDLDEYIEYLERHGIDHMKYFIEEGGFSAYLVSKFDGHLDIPDSVTKIGDYAFRGCFRLKSVNIPNSVTSIGRSAFDQCSQLTSVNIPDSVTTIGDFAFWNCRNLTSLTIPDSVTEIGIKPFSFCYGLTTISIPNSLSEISSEMFKGCRSLTSVELPNSLTHIGISAFELCESLKSIVIPDSVTTIDYKAFAVCENLVDVTIGNSVTTIGEESFGNCHSLSSITIPDSVEKIDKYAFVHCTELENITLGNSVSVIGAGAFEGCRNLKSIFIPESVNHIALTAFDGCKNLTIYVNSIKQHQLIKRGGFNCRVQINIDENSYRGIMMEALEALLLEAMSLDDIYQKYYSNIERVTFDKIASADPTGKPNKRGKHTEWLLNLYKAGNLKEEDLYKATEYLEAFHKFKNRIEQKDIRAYKSLPELYDAVKKYLDNPDQATSKSDEVRKIKEGAEKLYEDNKWLIIVPHTMDAAIYYGKGTQWCTAATSSSNYFDSYVDRYGDSCLFINIDKENNRKYQFCFDSEEFMDERDYSILSKERSIAETIGFDDKVLDFYSGVLCFTDWAYLKFPWGRVDAYNFDNKTYISVGNRLYLDRGGSDIVYLVKLPYDYCFCDKTYHGICVEDFDGTCVDIFDVDTNRLIFDHLKEDPLLMHEQSAIEFDDLDGYYVNCILTHTSKIREIITVQLYKIDDDEHLAHVYYDLRKKEVVSPIIDGEQYNAWHSSISPVYWLEDSNDDIVGASERNIIIFKHYDYRHDKHPIKVLDCSTGKTLNDTFFNTTRGYGYGIIRLPIITDDNKCYDLCFPIFLDKNNREIIISNDMTPIPFNGYSDIDSMIKTHPLDPEHQKLIKKRIRNIRR